MQIRHICILLYEKYMHIIFQIWFMVTSKLTGFIQSKLAFSMKESICNRLHWVKGQIASWDTTAHCHFFSRFSLDSRYYWLAKRQNGFQTLWSEGNGELNRNPMHWKRPQSSKVLPRLSRTLAIDIVYCNNHLLWFQLIRHSFTNYRA